MTNQQPETFCAGSNHLGWNSDVCPFQKCPFRICFNCGILPAAVSLTCTETKAPRLACFASHPIVGSQLWLTRNGHFKIDMKRTELKIPHLNACERYGHLARASKNAGMGSLREAFSPLALKQITGRLC